MANQHRDGAAEKLGQSGINPSRQPVDPTGWQTDLPVERETEGTTMRYCFFCGLPLNEKAVFCGYCGRRQPDAPAQDQPERVENDRLEQTKPGPEPENVGGTDPSCARVGEDPAVTACAVDWGAEMEALPTDGQLEAGASRPDPGQGRPPKRRSRKAWSGLPSLSGLSDLPDRLSDKLSDTLRRHWDQELDQGEEDPGLDSGFSKEKEESLEQQIDAAFANAWPVPEETSPLQGGPDPEPNPLEDTVLDAEWYPIGGKEHVQPDAPAAQPEAEPAPAPQPEREREPEGAVPETVAPVPAPTQAPAVRRDVDLAHVGQLVENPGLEQGALQPEEPVDLDMPDPDPEKKHCPWWVWVAVLAVVAAVGIGGVLWYREPVRSFERAFAAGDYSQALAVYQRAAENGNKAAAIQDLLLVHIAAIYQEYLDESLTMEEATAQLQTLNGFTFLAGPVQETVGKMEVMEASRQAYAQAEAAWEQAEYLTVIEWADQVIPEDSRYSDAQALRAQAVDAQAQLMLDQARTLLEAGEYAGAFAQLDAITETLGDLPQVDQARTEYVDFIVNAALQAAAVLADQGNYRGAVDRLQQTMDGFGTDMEPTVLEELTHMQAVYTSYIPVPLLELSVYATDMTEDDEIYWSQYLTDNQGTSYSYSLSATAGSVTYLLDGKYRNFSGVVAFPADAYSTALAPSARLEVYGDGVLLWSSGEMSAAVSPVYLDLNVERYNTLSLKWVCTGLGLWNSWGYYATLFNPVLQPVPIE